MEVTIRSGGTIFRASESTSDMHASIDAAVATLERQIRKNKTRLEKRLRQGAFERSVDEAKSLLCPTGRRGGVQPGPQQALPHQAHDPGRGHPSDESAGPQLLRSGGLLVAVFWRNGGAQGSSGEGARNRLGIALPHLGRFCLGFLLVGGVGGVKRKKIKNGEKKGGRRRCSLAVA